MLAWAESLFNLKENQKKNVLAVRCGRKNSLPRFSSHFFTFSKHLKANVPSIPQPLRYLLELPFVLQPRLQLMQIVHASVPAPSKGGLLVVFVYLKNSIKHPLEGLGGIKLYYSICVYFFVALCFAIVSKDMQNKLEQYSGAII